MCLKYTQFIFTSLIKRKNKLRKIIQSKARLFQQSFDKLYIYECFRMSTLNQDNLLWELCTFKELVKTI